MEYHGKFVHTLGRVQHISCMSRIEKFCTSFRLETQTVAPALTGFQGIQHCIQYLDSHPHKPIVFPSNSYDGSIFIRLTWSGTKVEDYTTHNYLECHKYVDHDIILNIIRLVLVIMHTLLGVAVCWKV